MRSTIVICAIFSLALSSVAFADSCMPALQLKPGLTLGAVTVVTLNKNRVASYSIEQVEFQPSRRGVPPQPPFPAAWISGKFGPGGQFFSDRFTDPTGSQPFASGKTDMLSVSITVAAAPSVSITLNSHGNGVSEFIATCSSNGILHGVADGVDFLLSLTSGPPPG